MKRYIIIDLQAYNDFFKGRHKKTRKIIDYIIQNGVGYYKASITLYPQTWEWKEWAYKINEYQHQHKVELEKAVRALIDPDYISPPIYSTFRTNIKKLVAQGIVKMETIKNNPKDDPERRKSQIRGKILRLIKNRSEEELKSLLNYLEMKA